MPSQETVSALMWAVICCSTWASATMLSMSPARSRWARRRAEKVSWTSLSSGYRAITSVRAVLKRFSR